MSKGTEVCNHIECEKNHKYFSVDGAESASRVRTTEW